jgi:uncharacterized protein YfaS (alpha-2-macroglobulin family)
MTKFRISATSYDQSGLIDESESFVDTHASFYASFELPPFMVAGDSLKIPITITNLGSKT